MLLLSCLRYLRPWCYSLLLTCFAGLAHSKDHAPVSPLHNLQVENFKAKYFLDSLRFSAKKVQAFMERLQGEQRLLRQEVLETELLERLELKVQDYDKALAKAKEEAEDPENLAVGYELYLIPKLKQLLAGIHNLRPQAELQSLFDDFMRGYVPYFLPNAFVTVWPRNFDFFNSFKHLWLPYTFVEGDEDKVAANNLQITAPYVRTINDCLGTRHQVNDFIVELETRQLRDCGFDLSKLDPGVSALWSQEKRPPVDERFFPRDNEPIDFKSINLRGRFSPKIKAEFTRNGKTYPLKIKLGPESHTDMAATQLFALLGYNGDSMQYRQSLTLHLRGTTFDEFRSEFANKYGIGRFNSLISAYDDRDPEDVTIRLNDVLLESRPEDEIRVSPFNIASWDLSNRREYRALLLLWGWVTMKNTQLSNFRFLYRKTSQGLIPQVRMSDTGSSFGSSMDLRKSGNGRDLLSILTVNEFAPSFMGWNHDEHKVAIRWSDLTHNREYFAQTTYEDLKWMARKIAGLQQTQIEHVLRQSGMPEPVLHLLTIKLLKRRNEMVEAFQLQTEYPLIPTPQLKNYTPSQFAGAIRKGKLRKKVFANKNQNYEVVIKWATLLPALLNFNVPVYRWRDKNTGALIRSSVKGLREARGRLRSPRRNFPEGFARVPLGVGIQALLSRVVVPNPQQVNDGKSMDIYQIVDRVRIKIDIDSPFLQRVLRKLRFLGLDGGMKFYEYDFEHIHYQDSVKKAYLSAFRVPEVMSDPNRYAALKMQPMELVRSYHRIGLEAFVGGGIYAFRPASTNELALAGSVRKVLNQYLLRDQYGQLHVYHDELRQNFGALDLKVAELDAFIARNAFLRFAVSSDQYRYLNTDHMLRLPQKDRKLADSLLTQEQREEEYALLKKITSANPQEQLNKGLYQYYGISAEGQIKTFGYGGLFIYNKDQLITESQVKVDTPDGERREFYRYGLEKSSYTGLQENAISTYDIFTAKRRKQRIVLEMDTKRQGEFVVILRNESFHRKSNREKLEKIIDEANRHYNRDKDHVFFNPQRLSADQSIDEFRRVHVMTRSFLDGKKFLKALTALPREEIKQLVHEHFLQFAHDPQNPGLYEKLRIHRKVARSQKWIERLQKKWLKLQNAEMEMAQSELGELIVNTLSSLSTYKYGNRFINQLMNQGGLFVMGDISGIYPSYSTLHDIQPLQRRRFVANSFGDYAMVPPLQKFLREHRIVQPSVHIDKTLSDRYIFGDLETALPPSIENMWDTDTVF